MDSNEPQEHPAGVPEGTELETLHTDPRTGTVDPAKGVQYREVVVHDYDEDGNVIGWHKEAVNG